jgi:DNA-damage-inducible protein D
MDKDLTLSQTPPTFEQLKRLNAHGAEFCSARDLQNLLGYKQWRRFDEAIQRAITSRKQSGNEPESHFAGTDNMVPSSRVAIDGC